MPRPSQLQEALEHTDAADPQLEPVYDAAIRETIARFEETGSPSP